MPNMTSYIKSFILWLMYVVFAATSFLFVQENLKDYVQGKTNFQESISIKGIFQYERSIECDAMPFDLKSIAFEFMNVDSNSIFQSS